MKKNFLLAFLMFGSVAFAQEPRKISGQIRDNLGYELLGATIQIKGTGKGTVTDLDGKFELADVKPGDVLIISYVGYDSKELKVGSQSAYNIVLEEDANDLEEVVVVGYGSMKSKDLTSPIASVSADEITKMNTSSAMSAIQGKVAGVNIVNNGAPGSGPSVQIRGVSSMETASPLYVVDGMFVDDLNYLNPSDIESMSVLKDASAAAIYGVRAANGVVIVTTKGGGKNQKARVTYDGYYAAQVVTQRLEMANSAQYAEFIRSSGNADFISRIDASIAKYGGENGIPAVSTDWYGELLKKQAPMHSHNLSVTGGTEKSAYAFSVGYFDQEGIMDATGEYNRINLRAKVDYDVTNKLKIGFTSALVKEKYQRDNNSAWFQAYTASPMYPVYDETLSDEEAYPEKFANPHNLGFDTYYTNPVAVARYHGDNVEDITRFMPTVYAEFKPWEKHNITFRSAMNMDFRYAANNKFTPEFVVGKTQQTINTLTKTTHWAYDYIWDNTITWQESWGNHNLTSMAGFSVNEDNIRWSRVTAQGVENEDYIDSGIADTRKAVDGGTRNRMMSGFTRFAYNYKYKYLATFTARADGSSRYQEKWGFFPSLGLGWVVSEEAFASSFKKAKIDHLKVRASWGLLGNDNILHNDATSSISVGSLGNSGVFDGVLVPGMINNSVYRHLAWEVVNEKNVGIETRMFDHRLQLDVDYYNRSTENMVIEKTLPMGNGRVRENSGVVRNSGVELALNWSDNIGEDFTYSVGANLTTIKNRVVDLDGEPYIQTGTAEYPQRSIEGGEIFSFYGLKVAGVYQNQAEIDACPIAKANNLKPGDFKYVDQNGDQMIDSKDRTVLGSPNPDLMYGFNVGLGYKGIYLSATFQGVSGVTLFNRKRADINKHGSNNIDANLANSVWKGEGTTNSTPSAEGMFNTWNSGQFNDFFLESGSYFRVQNIRLSYDFPTAMMKKAHISGLQVYLNADRPFTHFTSNGFTPEVPGGIDQEVYPIPSNFSVGARISF